MKKYYHNYLTNLSEYFIMLLKALPKTLS